MSAVNKCNMLNDKQTECMLTLNRWSKRKLLAALSRNKAQSLRKFSGWEWKASWETARVGGWKRQIQESARRSSGNYRHAQCKFFSFINSPKYLWQLNPYIISSN